MTVASVASARGGPPYREILKTEGEGAMLRISVEGGGCSGFQYKVDISARRPRTIGDRARQRGGAGRSRLGAVFLAGSEVDFVDDLIGASFRVVNPNATASCGCAPAFRSNVNGPILTRRRGNSGSGFMRRWDDAGRVWLKPWACRASMSTSSATNAGRLGADCAILARGVR